MPEMDNLMENKWYNTNILEKVFWDFPRIIGSSFLFLTPFIYVFVGLIIKVYEDICSQGLWQGYKR